MMLNPRRGQRVRVHHARRYARMMPHHGRVGIVRVVCRGKPRNHGFEIDGRTIAIPCGNLYPAEKTFKNQHAQA